MENEVTNTFENSDGPQIERGTEIIEKINRESCYLKVSPPCLTYLHKQ